MPDEEKVFSEIASRMQHISELVSDRARHATRSVHAKSHGLLKAELTVLEGLPEPLAQGMFRRGGAYQAIMRFSTISRGIFWPTASRPLVGLV